MDSSYNPGDLERADDLPGSSPGGVPYVEEPVGPQFPPSSDDTGREVTGDGYLADAEDEMEPFNIWVFPEPPNGTDVVFEVGDTPSWDQLMQTIQPEHRVAYETWYEVIERLVRFMRDPQRTHFSDQEISDLTNAEREAMRISASIPRQNLILIEEFFADPAEELARLHPFIMRRQEIVDFLDYLISNNTTSLHSETLLADSPNSACVICFEIYLQSDVVVVLPCHRSHHFHRACIQKWLLELVPGILTCPNCRTELVL
ncbi:hypothetical protein PCANC_18562 [Puccinia coronata f. sp. avenae]|uniref:RING-type E3 ubiquitin transferase n=1 Tax=Puccinia coronata f. sp. avenae TaxID=200324 RepID=A0A2N5VJY5_9BASI|nr:hypothetical protein PCANC_18562 [Puccinia coronata f. sp. avenae]PLW50311.1 hypothetical protein PCASD_01643 [Puccinia coronata f. sp. avenae]